MNVEHGGEIRGYIEGIQSAMAREETNRTNSHPGVGRTRTIHQFSKVPKILDELRPDVKEYVEGMDTTSNAYGELALKVSSKTSASRKEKGKVTYPEFIAGVEMAGFSLCGVAYL